MRIGAALQKMQAYMHALLPYMNNWLSGMMLNQDISEE